MFPLFRWVLPRFAGFVLSAPLIAVSAGCDTAPTTAISRAAAPAAALAGVRYDPGAPLDARLSPLGGEGLRYFHVHYRGANGENVPGILSLPSDSRGRRMPCVLLVHGLNGSKGSMLLPALALARRGYATLAIDIAGHGERPRLGGKNPDLLTLPETRQAVAQTVVDLRRAVDFLQTRPEIDPERIGFVGVSLGGILGGVFAAEEPRVKATALWSAGGDWGRLVTESTHPSVRRFRQSGVLTEAAVETQMADVDPARVAGRIAPRPLLMINGAGDTVVPAACARALYDAARQPKRLVTLPGGHVPDLVKMLDQTLAWFDENLKGSNATRRV